jgi:hypothetical protein
MVVLQFPVNTNATGALSTTLPDSLPRHCTHGASFGRRENCVHLVDGVLALQRTDPAATRRHSRLDTDTWTRVEGDAPVARFGHAVAVDRKNRRLNLVGATTDNKPSTTTGTSNSPKNEKNPLSHGRERGFGGGLRSTRR